MRKFLLISLLIFAALLPASAQKRDRAQFERQRKELIDFKIDYLMQEVDVPAEKRKEFEATYRKMEEEKHQMFEEVFRKAKALNKSSSDAEVLAVTDVLAGAKQREGAIEYKYYANFKKMLTPRQLLTLKRSEDRFNRKVMQMRGKGNKNKKK